MIELRVMVQLKHWYLQQSACPLTGWGRPLSRTRIPSSTCWATRMELSGTCCGRLDQQWCGRRPDRMLDVLVVIGEKFILETLEKEKG